MTTEEKFRAAVNVIRSLPKNGSYQPSADLMLRFYAYYKQATEGPCKGARPAFWEMVKKAKWDAWNRLGNMPREEAMDNYVEELKKIVETMSYTENVAQFLESLDSFYEKVPAEDLNLLVGNIVERVVGSSGESSPLRPSSPTHVASSVPNAAALAARFGSSLETSPASSIYSPSPQPPPSSSDRDTEDEEDEFIDTMEDGAGSPGNVNGITNGIEGVKRSLPNGNLVQASHKMQFIEKDLDANHNHRDVIVSQNLMSQAPVSEMNGSYISYTNGTDKVQPQAKRLNGSVYQSYAEGRPVVEGDLVGGRRDPPLNGHSKPDASRNGVVQNGSHEEVTVNGSHSLVPRDEQNINSVRQLVLDLQSDMEMIKTQLRNIEKVAMARNQRSSDAVVSRSSRSSSTWWPFPELSPQTTTFLVFWPFAVHFLFYYLRNRSQSRLHMR
ncbi:acyl-CoA-binding domain-containing protein 5 [Ischnura elegans]|uniref:acyl-CoA-binding domain-containing protein 5 n=1 Tax=Ischnura elegans TaxID=197161 RepID=UPI001ED896D4|nr:acyl-CoA-binding domain-containing protein 5 [Ischnura elegans]